MLLTGFFVLAAIINATLISQDVSPKGNDLAIWNFMGQGCTSGWLR
jgi:hypothetical protein